MYFFNQSLFSCFYCSLPDGSKNCTVDNIAFILVSKLNEYVSDLIKNKIDRKWIDLCQKIDQPVLDNENYFCDILSGLKYVNDNQSNDTCDQMDVSGINQHTETRFNPLGIQHKRKREADDSSTMIIAKQAKKLSFDDDQCDNQNNNLCPITINSDSSSKALRHSGSLSLGNHGFFSLFLNDSLTAVDYNAAPLFPF